MSKKWIKYQSNLSGLERLLAIDKIIWVEFCDEKGIPILLLNLTSNEKDLV